MTHSDPILEVQHVAKSYSRPVLVDVTFSLFPGEVVVLLGYSGAGKTTLLSLIGALEQPDSGTIFFQGNNIHQLSAVQIARYRNQQIGFIFQFHHLLPEFSPLENVMLPALIKGVPKKEARKKAFCLLERLGLQEKWDQPIPTLSGGEQQRVAVARALINNPSLVLADEPTGNLDSENALNLFHLFQSLSKEFNTSFLIATHNRELAALASRQFFLHNGVLESLPTA